MELIVENWKPVVCKQTQQFLHSNDERQKSEYKHFVGNNILRNKKQIIAQNKKRLNTKKGLDSASQKLESTQEISSVKATVIPIREVEFGGGPLVGKS